MVLGPAQRGEGPERAREPGVEHVRVLRPERRVGTRSALGRPLARDLDARRRGRARPGSDGPTRAAARRTSPGCSRGSGRTSSVHSLGDDDRLARAHRLERLLGHDLHLAETTASRSSARPPRRSADSAGRVRMCGFAPRARPFSASAFFTARRASLRSSPANGPALAFIVPSRFEDVDLLEAVALAGREVVEVVRRRHLHGPGAELRVDEDRVGHDRDRPVDERVAHPLAVERQCSVDRRGARRRPCRRASSRGAWWRRRSRPRRRRPDRRTRRALRSRPLRSPPRDR